MPAFLFYINLHFTPAGNISEWLVNCLRTLKQKGSDIISDGAFLF